MALNAKDVGVGMPSLNGLGFLIMLSLGNMRCFPHYLPFDLSRPQAYYFIDVTIDLFQATDDI